MLIVKFQGGVEWGLSRDTILKMLLYKKILSLVKVVVVVHRVRPDAVVIVGHVHLVGPLIEVYKNLFLHLYLGAVDFFLLEGN